METCQTITVFKCECSTEGLALAYEDESREDSGVEIAFWQCGHAIPYTLGWRLWLMWRVLTTGHPYTDMVILSKDTAADFAFHILKIIKRPIKKVKK